MSQEAGAECGKVMEMLSGAYDMQAMGMCAWALGAVGQTDEARRLLRIVEHPPKGRWLDLTVMGNAYGAVGDVDRSIAVPEGYGRTGAQHAVHESRRAVGYRARRSALSGPAAPNELPRIVAHARSRRIAWPVLTAAPTSSGCITTCLHARKASAPRRHLGPARTGVRPSTACCRTSPTSSTRSCGSSRSGRWASAPCRRHSIRRPCVR